MTEKLNFVTRVNGKCIKISKTWDEFLEMRKKGESIFVPHTGYYNEDGTTNGSVDVLKDIEDGTELDFINSMGGIDDDKYNKRLKTIKFAEDNDIIDHSEELLSKWGY